MKKMSALILSNLVLIVLMPDICRTQNFQNFLDRVVLAPEAGRTAIVDSFMNAVGSFPFIENDTIVHFIYRGTTSGVTVPGDANGWNSTAFPMTKLSSTNFWYTSKKFESDARLDYKFVLNGSTWILDPRNPYTVSGGYGPNSELRMPSYILGVEIQYNANIPHGTLRDTSFYSTNLNNSRTIRIYTPPSYSVSSDSFPVIIFHDGLEYISLAQANNVIDYLISFAHIEPVIAVFVPPVDRTDEYAGTKMANFSQFIVNELLPYIDSRYRTKQTPADRAVLGASNGGNISLWLGYNYPNVFGNVAAQSSNIITSISNGFQSSPRLNLKLYLDLGTYDIQQLIPLVRNFIPVLQSKDYPYLYNEYHEGHSWGNWRAHIDDALIYFFPGSAVKVKGEFLISPDDGPLPNYPNPFNASTVFQYKLSTANDVTLIVYNVLGQEIATLVNGHKNVGTHKVEFNGAGLPSGIYYYRMKTKNFTYAGKLLLLK